MEFPRELCDGRYQLEPVVMVSSKHGTWIFAATDTTNGRKLVVKFNVNQDEYYNEIEAMRMLEHDRLLKLYSYTELTESNLFAIILDRMLYGDLLDFINNNGPLNENIAAHAFYHLVEALDEMHSNNFIHRDIKLENIFIKDITNEVPTLVLGDFGYACKLQDGEECETYMGTEEYFAPEIIEREPYSFPVDVWAFGVALYIALVAWYPFNGKTQQSYFDSVLSGEIITDNERYANLSESTRNLISDCLKSSPDERITFKDMIDNDFFDEFYPERHKKD
jgi:serine/threonine protein kinase